MLHCSVEVCYTSRSKYATLLGPSKLHFTVQVCYTVRSDYATLLTQTLSPGDQKVGVIYFHFFVSKGIIYLGRSKLLAPSMLHCSVRVCYAAHTNTAPPGDMKMGVIYFHIFCLPKNHLARSKYATLLGPSMLHCSVEVCYTARSKYAALLGPSKLHFSVQICYTVQSDYAKLLTQTPSLEIRKWE
jgi:hypothetical protein